MVVLGNISREKFFDCVYEHGLPLYDKNFNRIPVTDGEVLQTFPVGLVCIYCKDSAETIFVRVLVIGYHLIDEWWDHPRIIVQEVDDDNIHNPKTCKFFYAYGKHDCCPSQLLPIEFLNSVKEENI